MAFKRRETTFIRSRRTSVNTKLVASDSKNLFKVLVLALAAFSLALSMFTLTGCGGSKAEEQDNCYGEDMPVINE